MFFVCLLVVLQHHETMIAVNMVFEWSHPKMIAGIDMKILIQKNKTNNFNDLSWIINCFLGFLFRFYLHLFVN